MIPVITELTLGQKHCYINKCRRFKINAQDGERLKHTKISLSRKLDERNCKRIAWKSDNSEKSKTYKKLCSLWKKFPYLAKTFSIRDFDFFILVFTLTKTKGKGNKAEEKSLLSGNEIIAPFYVILEFGGSISPYSRLKRGSLPLLNVIGIGGLTNGFC